MLIMTWVSPQRSHDARRPRRLGHPLKEATEPVTWGRARDNYPLRVGGSRQVRWTGDVSSTRADSVALQRCDINGLLQLALGDRRRHLGASRQH